MDSDLAALLRSWSLLPELLAPLLVAALVYVRGWRRLRRRDRWRPTGNHLACFLGGLAAIYLALASPLDPFGFLLVQVHMLQHIVLMFVAPPLVWLGAPVMPLYLGLPAKTRRFWIAPLIGSRPVQAAIGLLVRLAVAWSVFVVALWAWHLPQLYDLALRSWNVHYLEHACFFWSGVLFWWPVIQPYPPRRKISPWVLLPYPFLAGLQGTVISAILTFAGRVLYSPYAQTARLWGISALVDQSLAGAYMWVGGSIAYLIPLAWIGSQALYGRPQRTTRAAPLDLLRLPVLGSFFNWRHSRASLQVPLLVLAAVMIFDGLTGPQVAPLVTAAIVLGLVVLPAAGALSRRLGGLEMRWSDVARRFTYTLIPVSFGMWLAHYTFHLVTGAGTVPIAGARFLRDLGWRSLPLLSATCCTGMPPGNWLLIAEILFLDAGLLASLYVAYRNSRLVAPRLSQAVRVFAPWAVLIALLFISGIWIAFQPMQMRGTMMAGPGDMR